MLSRPRVCYGTQAYYVTHRAIDHPPIRAQEYGVILQLTNKNVFCPHTPFTLSAVLLHFKNIRIFSLVEERCLFFKISYTHKTLMVTSSRVANHITLHVARSRGYIIWTFGAISSRIWSIAADSSRERPLDLLHCRCHEASSRAIPERRAIGRYARGYTSWSTTKKPGELPRNNKRCVQQVPLFKTCRVHKCNTVCDLIPVGLVRVAHCAERHCISIRFIRGHLCT